MSHMWCQKVYEPLGGVRKTYNEPLGGVRKTYNEPLGGVRKTMSH